MRFVLPYPYTEDPKLLIDNDRTIVDGLYDGKHDVNLRSATIGSAYISNLVVGSGLFSAGSMDFTRLSGITLYAQSGNFPYASMASAGITSANISSATIGSATITGLQATTGTIQTLQATTANIGSAYITSATFVGLSSTTGTIGTFGSLSSTIQTLQNTIYGNFASALITTANITSATIGSATITSGNFVQGLSVSSGTIQTLQNATYANISSASITTALITSGSILSATVTSGNFTQGASINSGTIQTLIATTADINGGSLDGATVGAATPSTIIGTTIQANTGFVPDANDGAYLGTTALSFSDLFLASGGVINWANSDFTITHATGLISLSGHLALASGKSIMDSTGALELIKFTQTANAVNEITIANAVASSGPTISATGSSDANIDLNLTPKGTGRVYVQGSTTILAKFLTTAASGSSAGTGTAVYQDDGAAMASGDRLGFYLGGGAKDNAHTLNTTAGIEMYASEAWSSTASGSYLSLYSTPNTTTSRIEGLRLTPAGGIQLPNTSTPASVANTIELGARDLTAGNTELVLYTEGTPIKTITAPPVNNTTVAIYINGTQYYLLASTTAGT